MFIHKVRTGYSIAYVNTWEVSPLLPPPPPGWGAFANTASQLISYNLTARRAIFGEFTQVSGASKNLEVLLPYKKK